MHKELNEKDFEKIEYFLREISNASYLLRSEFSSKTLETLARALGCDWVVYWQVDTETKRLYPKLIWNNPSIQPSTLRVDTEGRSLSHDEGIAGQVWKSRKAYWSTDLEMDMCLPRSRYARNLSLNGGIWFPVMTEDIIYGVVELLGNHLRVVDQKLLDRLAEFGIEIGISKKAMG